MDYSKLVNEAYKAQNIDASAFFNKSGIRLTPRGVRAFYGPFLSVARFYATLGARGGYNWGMNRAQFYTSKKWFEMRRQVINRATRDDGFVYDELNGDRIIRKGDIIVHHLIELDDINCNDFNISLNPENLKVVSFRHHNEIHGRYANDARKQVYWLYGPPYSPSLKAFIEDNVGARDVVINLVDLKKALMPKAVTTDRLIFIVRDSALDAVFTRAGNWCTCYVVSTTIDIRVCDRLSAKPLFFDDTLEECLPYAEDNSFLYKYFNVSPPP